MAGGKRFVITDVDDVLRQYARPGGRVTDAWIASDTDEGIALLLDDSELWAVSRVRRGDAASSGRKRVELEELYLLEFPIAISDLQERLSGAIGKLLTPARRRRTVSDKRWEELLPVLNRFEPGLAKVLARLEERLSWSRPSFKPNQYGVPVLEWERDATGLALDMAGFQPNDRRQWFSQWQGKADAPFVDGLLHRGASEHRLIEHDARVFGNWDEIRAEPTFAVFESSAQRRVTIANVNMDKIEHNTGVDLIYFNHHYAAYVMVQYKRMARSVGDGWSYAIKPDLDDQLTLMRKLDERFDDSDLGSDGFRLNGLASYLKLCYGNLDEPLTGALTTGLYVPVEYWDLRERDGKLKGPKGGRAASARNLGRSLSNSDFTPLVANGWIGSRGFSTQKITDLVNELLGMKHSVMLAQSQ